MGKKNCNLTNVLGARIFFRPQYILDILVDYRGVVIEFLTLSYVQLANASSTRIHKPNKAKGGVVHGRWSGGSLAPLTYENVVVDFG